MEGDDHVSHPAEPYLQLRAVDPSAGYPFTLSIEVPDSLREEDVPELVIGLAQDIGHPITQEFFTLEKPFLHVTFTLPEDVPEDTVLETVREICRELDSGYRDLLQGNGFRMAVGGILIARERYRRRIKVHLALLQREPSDGFPLLQRMVSEMKEEMADEGENGEE